LKISNSSVDHFDRRFGADQGFDGLLSACVDSSAITYIEVILFLNQNRVYEALILLLRCVPEKKLKQFLSEIGIIGVSLRLCCM
jgi:hypothetical protein